jgi:hypothetical protein
MSRMITFTLLPLRMYWLMCLRTSLWIVRVYVSKPSVDVDLAECD